MSDKTIEPLKCKCGKEPLKTWLDSNFGNRVACSCGRSGPTCKTKAKAIAFWNEMMASPEKP